MACACRRCYKKIGKLLLLLLLLVAVFPTATLGAVNDTYIIPVEGDIDSGNTAFIRRAYADAISAGAGAILFEIDTYGGYIDEAIDIKDLIVSSQVPTVCFIKNKAISAGALIALAGDHTSMRAGTTIGAAEPRVGEEKADEKVLSMWSAQLSAVAERNGRDGQIAAAMADSDIVIEGIKEKDKLLTLSDSEALALGMADAICADAEACAAHFGYSTSTVRVEESLKEKVVSWLSNPYVAAILLTVGIVGIIIEILTPGFGIFGSVGVISFVCFFLGNYWGGSAGWGSIILFIAGIFLLLMEIFFIPGFGIAGVLGLAAMFAGIVFASPTLQYAAIALVIALVVSILLIILLLKNRRTRKIWGKLILGEKQENVEGYSSQDLTQNQLLGCVGRALTPLRPAGTAMINGERVDVITQGEFLDPETEIEVISISGGRVVVKAFHPEEK